MRIFSRTCDTFDMPKFSRAVLQPGANMDAKNWTLADGLTQNRRRDEALRKGLGSGSREKRRLRDRWQRVRPAAASLLKFTYCDLASVEPRTAVHDVKGFWRYEEGDGWPLLKQARESVSIRASELSGLQSRLHGAIAHLILGYPTAYGRHPDFWFEEATLRIRFSTTGPVLELKPEYWRVVLKGLVVLGTAQPWLRFCALCGRIFFRVKRQITCSPRCSTVLQGRRRAAAKSKGSQRGRKRYRFEQGIEATHNEWLTTTAGWPSTERGGEKRRRRQSQRMTHPKASTRHPVGTRVRNSGQRLPVGR